MDISKIRILHITDDLGYGGVQKVIYQLCKGTKDKFDKVMVASSGGVYVQKLNEIGVEHITIPNISSKNPFESIKTIKELYKIIKKYNVNIIHCHHRMAVLYARIFFNATKIIYNNHTIYQDKPILTHFALQGIRIIADGIQAKKNVVNYFGISENNVKVIYNAVDKYNGEYIYIPEIDAARRNNSFIVVNSSRFHPQKGLKYYIDAAKILIDKGYNIKFFLVGDGPQKQDILEKINNYGLSKNIILLGYRNDIKNVILQSDVLVLTSIYEGLPLTPMEAFSVKKAVIATNIDGTNEVVQDNFNGLLAESKNPISIASKIESVYLDKHKLDELNKNAYKTYINKFSERPFIERYLGFYKCI